MNCFFILGNNSGGGPDGEWEGLVVRGACRTEARAGWFCTWDGTSERRRGLGVVREADGPKPEPAGCLIAETAGRPGWEATWVAASGGLI